PGRSPLRQAGAQVLRRAELLAGVVVPLHHAAGDRCPRRGNRRDAEVLQGGVSMDAASMDSLYQEIILDHYRNPHHRGLREPDEAVLEDGIAFAGVAKFPARIKCALLSWMAFKDATAQASSRSSLTKEES